MQKYIYTQEEIPLRQYWHHSRWKAQRQTRIGQYRSS